MTFVHSNMKPPHTVKIKTEDGALRKIVLEFWLTSGGRDGLSGEKDNFSPVKLKLADIGLELSLAK